MFRHVIWDLGGTLVDTYPALAAAFAEVVADHGATEDVAEVERLTRVSTHSAITELSQRHGIEEQKFVAAHERLKKVWETQPAPAMEGAKEVMAAVRRLDGLNLVVTHRDRPSAQALIDALRLPVDGLISPSDGFPRKPDPAMHLWMLRRKGLDPQEVLAVGDRPLDSEAAHAAGIAAATLCPDGEPIDAAEFTILRLADVIPVLAKGTPSTGQW